MFDQSLITVKKTNKTWTMAASLVGQLAFVTLLCVIPLIYTDQIQIAKWRDNLMAPPVAAPVAEPAPVTHQTSSPRVSTTPVFRVPIAIPKGVERVVEPLSPNVVEAPSVGVVGAFGDSNKIGELLSTIIPPPRPPAPPTPKPTETSTKANGPVRVSQGVQDAKLLRRIVPVYPPLAITAHVQGTVHLLGVISKDGTIRDLQVVSGHPLLVRAALDAVRQWVYAPTLLSGEPVEVLAPIDVNFILSR